RGSRRSGAGPADDACGVESSKRAAHAGRVRLPVLFMNSVPFAEGHLTRRALPRQAPPEVVRRRVLRDICSKNRPRRIGHASARVKIALAGLLVFAALATAGEDADWVGRS